MAIIVNPGWKSKKAGDIVKFKNEEYEIGSTAFGSIQDAVAAGNTSDLVIVDKKLTSPVKVKGEETPKAITGAATDVFKADVKEAKSKDEKTETKTIKFSAAAGGTASIKDADAALVGFDKVTAKTAGGVFQGGKQDVAYSSKRVTDSDKGIENVDETVTRSSKATGAVTVTGKDNGNRANVAVAGITDADMPTEPADAVKKTYKAITGNEYDEASFVTAAYASVNLKYANTAAAINGGTLTEKAVFKTTSASSGDKTTENYSYSKTAKAGTGTAVVTDSNVGGLLGFKSVTIAAKTAASPMTVAGKIDSGSGTETLTVKTAYTADKSYSYDYVKNSSSPAGKGNTLTIKGLDDSKVTVNDKIKAFDTVNLTNAVITKELDSEADTEKETVKIAVKDQKGTSVVTFNGTKEGNEVVGGKSLTATNTTFADGVEGFASITFKAGVAVLANKDFDSTNQKSKTTKKQSGTAVNGITNDKTQYPYTFNPVVDAGLINKDEAYTFDYSKKEEKNVGGTKFSASGAAGAYTGQAYIKGFKTVDLNNSGANVLRAGMENESSVNDTSIKESFTPEKAYSYTQKNNSSAKAVGTASLKGKNITVSNINGFASIKVAGSEIASMKLDAVTGQNTFKSTSSMADTIKAGKENPIGNHTYSSTESSKLATELDANKVTLSGTYRDLKKAKLTDAAGAATFTNASEYDEKASSKVTWNAGEISSTEPIPGKFDEKVTSYDEKYDLKRTVAGEFTLKNSAAAAVTALQVNNYKKADITLAAGNATADFTNTGDFTWKKAVKRTVSDKKRTQNYSDSTSTTATGSLKITGDKTTPNTLTLSQDIGYSSIELKDVKLTGAGASAYSTTVATTATETATLDSGDVTAVTLKYSYTRNQTGNGSFKASATNTAAKLDAFAGTLSGFGTVELKKTVISVGAANNVKNIGFAGDTTYVVWNTDYFDVIAVNNGLGGTPGTALNGNITGTYSLDKKGLIDSKWTGTYSTLSGGTFTQEAAIDNVTAGAITGYDKVTLNRIKTVGAVDGTNTETTRVLTYKVGKDEEVTANSDVTTVKTTSSSSISVTGTEGQASTVDASITGYKTVELKENVTVTGAITAKNTLQVTTTDNLTYNSLEQLDTAEGTLTATKNSTLQGAVDGFQTVSLTDTAANVNFDGGTSYSLRNTTAGKDLDKEEIAAGAFTAKTSNATSIQLGTITGFQNVTLTDYKSGAVAVKFAQTDAEYKATSFTFTPADSEKETKDSWQKAAVTKGNTFTATVDKADNEMTVATIDGYDKVTVSGGAKSVAAITNAFITDKAAAFDRIYGAKHYGNWTAAAQTTETGYTAISVKTGSDVSITGVKDGTQTAVTGNIAGYGNITLDYVKVGTSGQTATYAGGSYTYSTTTKDDVVSATSKNAASGKLAITNAQSAAADAAFKVEGFQTVAIDLTAAATKATFESIIGGTEEATFTGATLNTVKYTVAGSLDLKVEKTTASAVTGTVAGFSTMNFTDVNFSGAGDKIIAYSIPSKDKKSVAAAVTFDNNKDGANTIVSNIAGAKTVTFKATAPDASDDFTVTGKIESNAASAGTKIDGNTTVTFEKAQVSLAFANFDLDAGDVLNFVSDTADASTTATLNLGAIDAALTADVWKGVSLTGTGTVKFSGSAYGDADAFKTALKEVAKATVADTITFVKG